MKFVCLGYIDEAQWDARTVAERAVFVAEVAAYHDELRPGGRLLISERLQGDAGAVTLRAPHGRAMLVEGASVSQSLAQILLLEARDLNHAVQLLTKHPIARLGAFEIRLADTETSAPATMS
jgi:hypothetical protein